MFVHSPRAPGRLNAESIGGAATLAFALLLVLLLLLIGGCPGDNTNANDNNANTNDNNSNLNDNTDDTPEPVSQTISAAAGGKVSTASGYSLDIPAGALAADQEITLAPLGARELAELDESFLAGVTLEPDGLEFSTPAELRVPLPEPWPEGSEPIELVFKGSDPTAASETGLTVELSADRRTAIFRVTHFSGRICANQCHAGVREYLAAQYNAKGCPRSEWSKRVVGKYPGLVLRETCESITTDDLNSMLDSFFDEVGAYAPGQDVPEDVMAKLVEYGEAGRNVVIIFATSAMARGGDRMFPGGVAHSCLIEKKDGIWQMRHVFIFNNDKFLAHIGGTNLFHHPLSDLNNFRRQKSGVGVELAFCGTPGCFGSDDPEDLLKPYDPLEKRVVPWGGCRIFVERLQNSPCNRLGGCWEFDVTSEGETSTLLVKFNDDGHLDSLWTKTEAASEDGSIPAGAWIEVFRFARSNISEMMARNVEEAVFLSVPDQAQFTMTASLELADEDEEGRDVSTSFSFTINDALLSQNQPAETFSGQYVQVVETVSYDDEGNRMVDTQNVTAAIVARRVDCPSPEAGTGIAQQDWFAAISVDLCGDGAELSAPLIAAGMLMMRFASRWRMPRRRRAA
ncbi:hypothetical protein RAS1_27180 [Phycisphaerae bacterium RAS1]|nr:hypothetical protein RAS1_27180 [Phycisphaerae bacterium RAS1]